jgi:hypothetical protein
LCYTPEKIRAPTLIGKAPCSASEAALNLNEMASVFLVPFGSVVLTMKIIGTNKPKLELFFISQDWHTKKSILMQVHGRQDFINLIKTVKGFAHAD